MDISEAIRTRKSVRNFKPEPVPKKVLKEIINTAIRAPSTINTQPWEIAVVTGEVLDNIKRGNIEEYTSGVPTHPEIPTQVYEGKHRQRQVELAIQIFELMGIARGDKEKREDWRHRGFRFFDAPAAIIISADKSAGDLHPLFDIGSLSQTICLAALEYGLATCIEDQGAMFPEVIRKFVPMPESHRIIIAIAIGYPDWDFPANKLESKRDAVENVTTWHGFD